MLALNGSPSYLGTITSTAASSVNAFAIPAGSILCIQPDAEVTIVPVASASGVVTAGTGIKLAANERFYCTLTRDQAHLACIGAANVKVFRLA